MLLISILWSLNGILFERNTVLTLVTAATFSTHQFYSYKEIPFFSRGNGMFLIYLHCLHEVLDDVVEVFSFFMVSKYSKRSLYIQTGLDSLSEKS